MKSANNSREAERPPVSLAGPESPSLLLYSRTPCGWCVAAKSLLERAEIPFQEIDLSGQPTQMEELRAQTGMSSFPQILSGERLIGGARELMSAYRDGSLRSLLEER